MPTQSNGREESRFPRLVIFCGLPSAGKSTCASYLAEHHGFQLISSDAMRALLWGQQFDQEYRQSIFRDQKEHVLMRVCHVMKVEHLFNGRDVVIDSCALSNRTRRLLFDTNIVDRFSVVATKYLLHVAVTGHTISERNRGRGRVSDWVPRWVPPVANREYRIIHLHNDTEAQLQENFRLLDQHFSE